jgi:hypothetical protein
MAESKYDKYLVRAKAKGPGVILMNEELVPGCNVFIMANWILKQPGPNPMHASYESHDYDEIILNIGADPLNPECLGGEIQGYMGGEYQLLNTTSALFIPRHVPHGRISWKSFERPPMQMAIKLSGKIEPMGPPKT